MTLTIQGAIKSSADGDTILVATGTYYKNVNFRGKNVLLSSHYLFDEDVNFINTKDVLKYSGTIY